MADVLIRLAAPDEYEAIGELGVAAYSHDYEISDGYRRSLRDVAARAVMNSGPNMTGAHQLDYAMGFTRLTERETRIVDGHTRPLLAFGCEVGDGGRL